MRGGRSPFSALVLGCFACAASGCAAEPSPVSEGDTPRYLTRPERPPHPDPLPGGRGSEGSGAPLTLEEALAQAEAENPALRALERAVEEARGREVQAGLYPNPSIEASSEDGPLYHGPGQSTNVAGVTQPFVLGARLRTAEAAARAEREAAEAALERAGRELGAEVRDAFVEALLFRDQLALGRELLDIARVSRETADKRFRAGDVPEGEVLKAEVEERRLGIEVERAETELRRALLGLGALLGDPTAAPGEVSGALPDDAPEAPPLDELRRAVLDRYPGITEATRLWEQKRFELALARAERVPDVDVSVGGGHSGEGEGILEVGISFPIPLWDRNQGRIAEAEAAIGRAAREAESTANAVLFELEDAHRRYALARAQVKTYREELLPRVERVLEQARSGYAGGKLRLLDVLDAQRTLGETRALYLDARHDLAEAEAELEKFGAK